MPGRGGEGGGGGRRGGWEDFTYIQSYTVGGLFRFGTATYVHTYSCAGDFRYFLAIADSFIVTALLSGYRR